MLFLVAHIKKISTREKMLVSNELYVQFYITIGVLQNLKHRGQNYLALIGRWFTKYVVLATIALRFTEVDENGIIDLMFCSLFFMTKFSCLKAVE